jgi:formamidopyrimidine-DNA glycosylase
LSQLLVRFRKWEDVMGVKYDPMQKTELKCVRCNTMVYKETDKKLKKKYSYYCPTCDENMFEFEVTDK